MQSDSLKNPRDAGKAFNEKPHKTFYPITEDERQRERNRVRAMQDYIRKTLDLSLDSED
jgi:hypothetical protein